ncbi:MAG: ribose 5-phosphate isomerase B [Bacteroidota bacterium]
MKTIAIGCDHAGYEYKEAIKKMLTDEGYTVTDFGTNSLASVDYPDFVHPACNAIVNGEADFGVLLCGSANGVAITANKHQHIRAALCWMKEIAELSRQHNNANVICIPARYTSKEQAKQLVNTFLTTNFEGGRHANRVKKIPIEVNL